MPRGGLNPDGTRRGGRKPGSLNRKTIARRERQEAMAKEIAGGAVPDPAGYAACIWNDPTSTKAERMQAWKDAAPYMWPRLARSTLDPLHTVDAIAKAGAGF